jgi:hypothetical protein
LGVHRFYNGKNTIRLLELANQQRSTLGLGQY